MIPFAIRCVTMVALLMIRAGAIPPGILVREEAAEDCCSGRLEITSDGEAFSLKGRDPEAGTVHDVGGKLQVEMAGKTRWVLSPDGSDWIDQDKRRWVPRESLVKTDLSWTTVRIQVVDQDKRSVEEFGYEYRIEGKDGRWDPMLVRPLQGKAGWIEIKAPEECSIALSIEHPDFTRGYGTGSELDRKQGSAELVAEFKRGRTIRGKVVDEATGKPLTGAVVSPLVFTPPHFSADAGRSQVTGADGAFALRGVDSSFAVSHPDFLKQEIFLKEKDGEKPHEVRMKKGITIRGIVSDLANKALAGVEVNDGSGKTTVTGEDGRFVLNGLRQWSDNGWWLEFYRDGYNEVHFQKKKIEREGVVIKLVPLPELRGRVVLADGTPARKYRIVCGPGAIPSGYQCVKAEVDDNEGRFVIRPEELPEKGDDYWLGIRTEGAAPWDGVVSLANLKSGDLRIVLKDGAALSATLALPATAQEPIKARLEPTDRLIVESFMVSTHPGKELASYSIPMKRGETLRIPHLRTGNYQLRITSKGATPLVRPVVMGSEDVALGELRLDGTGSISGVVNEPYEKGKAWRFADGQIFVAAFGSRSDGPYLKFKTDVAGKFRVDGVPVGMVTVAFSFKASADMFDSLSREARVTEGKDTEVRFEGDGGAWAQPLRLLFDGKEGIPVYKGIRKVGNVTDRKPMFIFEATALDSGPVSGMRSTEWSADEKSGPAIADLSPGRWRIRVFDWLGSRGFNEGWKAEAVADVGGKRAPIAFELGSKTLSGKVAASRETKRLVQMIAVAKSNGRAFLSRCDDEGDFVIRYLPQDEYLVHAHDDKGGWCDLGRFHLDKATVDCGVHALRDGGHAEGKLANGLLSRLDEIQISARAPDGLEIPVDEVQKDGSYRFGHLRPGKWTFVTRLDEKEISRSPAEIQKAHTVRLNP